MPPEDNTPDFDSMTQEEIMAWMEALAVRQGATEGIISDEASRPKVQEIDPTTVDIKDNYIPYGMTAEQWEKKQAEERAKKEAKKSSTPAPTPQPVSAPPPPTPTPTPVATQPAADATPDFDSMTPEQIMAWMEALAVRQGATEGIISDEKDRPQVVEIDPNSVDTSAMGNYIPYGMTAEQWEKKQAEERAKKEAKQSSKPQVKTPFTPPPQTDLPVPVLEDSPTQPAPVFDATPTTEASDWLSGLASGATSELPTTEAPLDFDFSGLGNELPDLSDLGGSLQDLDLPNFELEGLGDLAGLADGNTDPVDWLNNLVSDGQPSTSLPTTTNPFDSLFDEKPATKPVEGNTIEWLESLAKKQGVSDDELITRPEVDLPNLELDPNFVAPENDPFNFDSVDNLDQAAIDATDPVAWLEGLAEAQNTKAGAPSSTSTPKDVDTTDMLQKLNKGISDPDDMKGWMDKLLEEGAKRQVPDYIEEEEAPIEANIPDWLVEQVGLPPEMGGTIEPKSTAEIDFDALISAEPLATNDMPDWLLESSPIQPETEAVAGDMPDWLQDTVAEQSDTVQDIFATTPSSPLSTEEIEVDMSDPWVEAFELERKVAMGLISDEQVIFSDEPVPFDVVIDEVLEDEPLPMGELESLPVWMDTSAPVTPTPVETIAEPVNELPDWLRETEDEAPIVMDEPLPDWLNEAGIENTEDVPDWLLETVEEEQAIFTPPTPAPTPVPTPAPVVVKPQSPAPVPVSNINIAQVLQQARAKVQSGDLEGGLGAYEAVIRANTALDNVVSDLTDLVKQEGNKTNASIYRVLGDGLMRQGRLQQALDTYRKALNLL